MRANRDFQVFWVVQSLSELGKSFALVALPLLMLQATGSVAQMGLLTAVAAIGSILTGLIAGAVVDRWDRRRLMIWCDLGRAVLFGTIPLWWLVGPQTWLLYAVIGLGSVLGMVFDVAYVTAVPALVPLDRLTEANGRLQASNALAYVVGPALAGVLVATVGATSTIGVNALTFAVSALGLVVIRYRPVDRSTGPATAGVISVRGFVEGLRFLWQNPVLRMLTVLLTVITFFSLGLTDVFIYYVRHTLHEGDQAVGIVLGLASVGSILAAAFAARLRRWAGFGACWLGSFALCGAAVAAAGFAADLATLATAAVAFTFGSTLAGVCSMTLRQELTPDQLLGRVTAAFWTLHSAFGPLGAAVVTFAVSRAGVRLPLVAVGIALLLSVVAGWFSPVRGRDPT